MTTIVKNLAGLRREIGLTQNEVAERMKMSRSSYIATEQGKRDLTISEAERLAGIVGISVGELLGGITPRYDVYRDMIIAMLQAVARGAGAGKVPKTKLAKLLYLADFAWFYEHMDSMSGLGYRKIQFGPVPDTYFRMIDELEEKGLIEVEHKTTDKGPAYLLCTTRAGNLYQSTHLSSEQIALMNDIEKKWHDVSTNEIVAFTHGQLPYKLAGDGELISYALIGQEDHDNVF